MEDCGNLIKIGAFAAVIYVVGRTHTHLRHLYFHATKKEHFKFRHPYTGFKSYHKGPKELSEKF
jgi:hypothetical protein